MKKEIFSGWKRIGIVLLLCVCGMPSVLAKTVSENAEHARPATRSSSKGELKREASKLPKVIYLTPALAKILRMTKAGVTENVIVAYIHRQPFVYPATPTELIELHQAGVSPGVLKALVEHVPSEFARMAPALVPGANPSVLNSPTPWATGLPEPVPAASGIYNGQWQYMPGYGWWWQPGFGNYAAGWPDGNALSIDLSGSAVAIGGEEDHGHHHHHGGGGGGSIWESSGRAGGGWPSLAPATPWLARRGASPFGVLGAGRTSAPGNPWLPLGGVAASSSLPPYGILGQGPAVNSGQSPWLPLGGEPASGTLPPYGIVGEPVMPDSGLPPNLPLGGVPASGVLPPYGIVGVPPFPNNGLNPYLPLGGQAGIGFVPPFGIAPSVAQMTMEYPGFPALPAAPTLPAAPMLPGGPFPENMGGYLQNYAFLGRAPTFGWPSVAPAPLWPSAPTWPSVPAQVPYGRYGGHAGFRGFPGGAGFHGAGGFHGAVGVHGGGLAGGGHR